jgi:16S rRNA (adenine1518-N6/adenine1519-N6)-dimethyltransferase
MRLNPIEIIRRYQITPRKKFGQNFLLDLHILERIAGLLDKSPAPLAIEIGPGIGNLTQMLLALSTRPCVIAVERDLDLATVLNTVFDKEPKERLVVMHDDILNIDLNELCARYGARKVNVIGNLPFNVSARILVHLAAYRPRLNRMVLMFQKEVAHRIKAAPGTRARSFLSCLAQYHFSVRSAAVVKKGAFFPQPEVDAEVLVFDALDAPACGGVDEKEFFRFVAALFTARRKTVLNTGSAFAGCPKEKFKALLKEAHCPEAARVEELDLETLCEIFRRLP